MYSNALIALASVPIVSAWGTLGHETIGFIAQNLIKDHTETWAQGILNDTSSSYLANVSTWADSFRYTDEGSFSSGFHYIDAEDDPPSSCNVDYDRDCSSEDGCVVSAIANYTQRVQSSGNISSREVDYALRFLVHFIGDITQPLHNEAFELGGNGVNVTFNNDNETNLHSVWDTAMPEELIGGYELSDAKNWADNLTAEIENGVYQNATAAWASGLDIDDAKGSAMTWARDANKYVCSVVMPDGAEPLESGDLYPEYYDGAIDTVELQVAKAGYRLAAWLDAIAAKQVVSRDTTKPWTMRHGRANFDMSGVNLLPSAKAIKSKARLRREAFGGCTHRH